MEHIARLWELYDEAMRQWHEEMREHFGPISPPMEDWAAYMRERPAPVPPLVRRPTTQGVSGSSTPLGTTPRGSSPVDDNDQSSPAVRSRPRTRGVPGSRSGFIGRRSRGPSPSHSHQSTEGASPRSTDGSSPSTSRRRQSGGGRGCCGSDDVEEGAHRRSASPSVRHPDPQPEPVRHEVYYTLDDSGAIVMDGKGKNVRLYLHDSVYSHVRNVYDEKTYRSNVIDRIVADIHSRFPMPENERVNSVWLRRTITGHIANRRSNFTKRAREVLRRQAEGLPPLNSNDGRPLKCHNKEWRDAKARASLEPSARHVAARATQMSTIGSPRFGSGGLSSFRAEFVSLCLSFLVNASHNLSIFDPNPYCI